MALPAVGLIGEAVIGSGAAGAGLVGAKAGMLLSGSNGNYKEFINQLVAGYTFAAQDTPGLTLPSTPTSSDLIKNIIKTQGNMPTDANGMRNPTPGVNYVGSLPQYTSSNFANIINNASNSLLSSNQLAGDDPTYGKFVGRDLAPTALADYAEGADTSNMFDLSNLTAAQINEQFGGQDDLTGKVFYTNKDLNQGQIAAINKSIFGVGNEDRAFKATAKKYGMTIEELKSLQANPMASYTGRGPLISGKNKQILGDLRLAQSGNQGQATSNFLNSMGSRKQKGYQYLTFGVGGTEMSYGQVGNGLKARSYDAKGNLVPTSQFGSYVSQIDQTIKNQQNIIQQQQTQAELERENAKAAIYNQWVRSNKRRGY